ncbi:acetyltransferase [Dolichospermum planctonicum UHCC 0167]|uniref:acetyltransferase n=1 Tax=Dolichospermum planctonicum TaxID=136072 RepID=UPI0014435CA0|nr:acetyltransferase [Dolichospermum planctonicum]MCW9680964.1 acetyltransferase [Dolichospermum planctonicum UHCC 0167]
MSKVVIFGNSFFAESIYFYLKHDSDHQLIAFTVDESHITSESFHDLPVVAYEKLEKYYPPTEYNLFIPLGYERLNKLRAEKYYDAKKRGYGFISYISSQSVSEARYRNHHNISVGENCLILENSIIEPQVIIGDNCILAGGNHIGHHSIINNHCFIASHVVFGGGVVVGEYTFIGMNATIRNAINIGKENIIGAGSIILSNTEDQAVYSPGETPKFQVPSNLIHI